MCYYQEEKVLIHRDLALCNRELDWTVEIGIEEQKKIEELQMQWNLEHGSKMIKMMATYSTFD